MEMYRINSLTKIEFVKEKASPYTPDSLFREFVSHDIAVPDLRHSSSKAEVKEFVAKVEFRAYVERRDETYPHPNFKWRSMDSTGLCQVYTSKQLYSTLKSTQILTSHEWCGVVKQKCIKRKAEEEKEAKEEISTRRKRKQPPPEPSSEEGFIFYDPLNDMFDAFVLNDEEIWETEQAERKNIAEGKIDVDEDEDISNFFFFLFLFLLFLKNQGANHH